jgi:CRP/FNR family transcriptional regulator
MPVSIITHSTMSHYRAGATFHHTSSLIKALPEQFASCLRASARTVSLPQGKILFEKGDAGDGCYWLEEGVLKVILASQSGEQRILAILGAGAIVGELAMIDGLPRSATVEAVRDCRLSFVSRATFHSCLAEHPKIYDYLINTLVARLRQADDEAAAASFLSVGARIARAVLQFAYHLGEEKQPGKINIRHAIRQSDLAAMAGVARESVSRTLGDWNDRQIIERMSRNNYVIYKSKLERVARSTTVERPTVSPILYSSD